MTKRWRPCRRRCARADRCGDVQRRRHRLSAFRRVELAVDCFERAIGLSPNFAVAHYNLGAALERQGRIDEAMAALRRAIALTPELGRAYSRLGNLLQAQGNPSEANVLSAASESLDDPADRELEQAKLLLDDARPTAEPLLRHVIDAEPTNGLAHVMLGDVLGESGLFPRPPRRCAARIELDPERVAPGTAWPSSRGLGRRPFAVRTHAGAAGAPGGSDFDRIMLHFALGKAHDDLHEPAEAIGHFDGGMRWSIAGTRSIAPRSPAGRSADRCVHRHAARPRQRPAGLHHRHAPFRHTLVEQIVSAHPAVAAGGELTFWTSGTAAGARRRRPRTTRAAAPAQAHEALRVDGQEPFQLPSGRPDPSGALPKARSSIAGGTRIDTCLSLYFTRFAGSAVRV